jgi:riboflavin biosynthesis pyrimidine reductase
MLARSAEPLSLDSRRRFLLRAVIRARRFRAGVLLGSGKLATELDRLDLIDEYQFLVHPRIAGHGPTLYQSGLPSTRRLQLVSAKPLGCGAVVMHYRRAR